MTTRNKPNGPGRRGRVESAKTAKPDETPPAKPMIDLLERVSDGFVAFDAGMNYVYVNARGAELLGRKPEDLIGKNYWVEFPEAKGTPFADAYVKALKTQKSLVIEDYYAPWERWFENRIYPSKDGLSIFFSEITERKRAEMALRESREQLALAIHSANVGLWDWDLQINKVYFSPEWKSQLGYEDHEISNDFSEWESRVHPDDLERAKATVVSFIEKPYPNFQNEFRMRHKDGSYRWILAHASLLYDEKGTPVRMIGSHIDITERKQAEETLRINEEFLSAIYNHTNVGIFVVRVSDGGEFRYEGINPAHEKLLGLTNSQVAGRSPDDLVEFFGAESMNYVKALYSECAQKKKPVESEFFVPEGAARGWWFSRLTPLVDAKTNDAVRLIGTSILITDRKRAEQALQRNEQVLRLFVEYSPASIAMFDREMKYIVASRRYLIDYDLGEQNVVGRSHYEIFPEIPERWKEIHKRCLAGAVEKADEDPFPRASGKLDWVRWEIRPWYESTGEIGGVILFSEVITERKQAKADIQRRLQELETLHQASLSFNQLQELNTIGTQVLEHLEQMMHYERGAIVLRNETTGRLELIAHARMNLDDSEYQKEIERVNGFFELPQGITRWVAEHGETIRTGNVHSDPRYLEADPAIQSEMAVPLKIGERVIGALNVESVQPGAFSEHDERLLITVANVAAVAIQNARLLEETRLSRDRLAELSRRLVEMHEIESRAIGRELHDQIGQMLTALKLTIEVAMKLPPDQALQKARQGQEIVNDLLARVSALSLELRPPMLDDLGLLPALVWHVNRYQEQTQIGVEFKHSGIENRRFDPQIETTVYRIAQESLTNVARHARAMRVRIEVRTRDDMMEIEIEDDGVGFDPQTALAMNRGLTGMRERAQLIGGVLQIESEPGKGTRKLIRLPLREENQ